MTDFEDQLRRALSRKDPPGDFAARVVAKATQPRRSVFQGHWRPWAAAGIAASFLVVGLSVDVEHRRQEQGQAARTQLLQAMQITSAKLAKIHQKVQGSNR